MLPYFPMQAAYIKENIVHFQERLATVCAQCSRHPRDITLIGVTKFADAELIKAGVEAGLTHIAENKVQEAIKKFHVLEPFMGKVTRHMIGHLQTNKVKQALRVFDMIQSVDRLKLAEEIERQACAIERVVDVLIQVNTSGEQQKYGIDLRECVALMQAVAQMPHIKVHGLMTIAPLTQEERIIRDCFRQTVELRDNLREQYLNHPRVSLDVLSMGMSGDFKIAIEEGATMIRIGSAVFTQQAKG